MSTHLISAEAEAVQEKDTSLTASIRDGVSTSVMLGAGETYIGVFGIFLHATTLQVGLLATLPQLFGAVMQWASAQALDRFHRRRVVLTIGASLQALLWVPVALLPFYFGKGGMPVAFLMGFLILYHGISGTLAPVWNSLIGDLVPPDIRGRFFGNRNRLTGMGSFFALLVAGGILNLFQSVGNEALGFLVIFSAAGLARLNSARWLARYDDPPLCFVPEQVFTFRQFLRRSPHSNFAKFVFFVGAINFGVAFSAPYFALYMLRDLHFSYLQFTAVVAVAVITQFLTFRYWGGLSDQFGNKKIMNLCGLGVGLVPLLWLASSHIFYLVLIQIFCGLVWAGFSLATANFIFDAVTPPKRARCVAYHGLINGACVFVGSLAGGFTAGHLPEAYRMGDWVWRPDSTLPMIFLLSGLMRLVAAGLFLNRFKEVRPVEPICNRELIFRVSHIKPIAGATFSIFTGFIKNRNGAIGPNGEESCSAPQDTDSSADEPSSAKVDGKFLHLR
jgi:MFS family permease